MFAAVDESYNLTNQYKYTWNTLQSKRELQLAVVLDQEMVVFSINTWSGTYKPGPDGKFLLKRTEDEESMTVEQIKSPSLNSRFEWQYFIGCNEYHCITSE